MNVKIKWVGDNGTWQAKYNLLYGVIMPLSGAEDGDYKYVYGVMLDPGHTAHWRHAKTLRGAKWLCGKILRHGRDWKKRRRTPNEELKDEFERHVRAIEGHGATARQIYPRCISMMRIWTELIRRGEEPVWPDLDAELLAKLESAYPTKVAS